MSFGGLFNEDGSTVGDLQYNSAGLAFASVSRPMLNSAGLSLGLLGNQEGQREKRKEDQLENESRSGSDNYGSGDELEHDNPRKKKRYHRHTPQQIQELEAVFKEFPHPDEKQRLELSKRLSLETRQVKFWFQNRRTQMKTQLERHENSILRNENEKLRAESLAIRDAMRNPVCGTCGSPAILGDISAEEQQLRVENARLKDELERLCTLASKFLGKPISDLCNSVPLMMPSSGLELAVGNNDFGICSAYHSMNLAPVSEFSTGQVSTQGTVVTPTRAVGNANFNHGGIEVSQEKLVFFELALAAMDELVKMADMGEPLWMPTLDVMNKDTLNFEEYHRRFPACIGPKTVGFATEASRVVDVVTINSLDLVSTLMDPTQWAETFPSIIARTSTTEVISNGIGGTKNGALQLMHAEFQVLSPLVPVSDANFLRFCKQLAEGVWAIVDVSIEGINNTILPADMKYRRLPSGCVVQSMPNGYSKVRWVEHSEYDETTVHPLYRSLFRSGLALGALRWLATLQRQCQSLAIKMPSTSRETDIITPAGKRSMRKLAQRMTKNFCTGVCPSSAREWSRLNSGINVGEDVKIMTRQNVADPGEPPGVVLSAATSVWLPVTPHQLFDFLRNEEFRCKWDILSNGGPMHEMAHISKGQGDANAVSLLRASDVGTNQANMLILQETCTNASGSMIVYAPVDVPAMHLVMSGGDSAYVALLPSGFVIVPGSSTAANPSMAMPKLSGSLLTVAFQILVNSQPTAKLTVESVETVNNLISCTVQKIKAALNCES